MSKCECRIFDEALVKKVIKSMPEEEMLYDLADFFKVFGDSTRIKIIYALFNNKMCVCDIASTINLSHSAVSHQLKTLKNAKLVKSKRKGKEVFYELDDKHVENIFEMAYEHLNHLKTK